MAVTDKQITGQRGEDLARAYLEKQGYEFVEANWRCKAGEVDLIMWEPRMRGVTQTRRCLVFVEVRTRQPTEFGLGYETVAWQKQKKLTRAAKWYMQKKKYWDDARFDVVSIIDDGSENPEIEHIEYAFDEK